MNSWHTKGQAKQGQGGALKEASDAGPLAERKGSNRADVSVWSSLRELTRTDLSLAAD
jgi:hypothetical protein